MLNYKQINYIQTMLAKASKKTKQDFEDSGVLLNKETSYYNANAWIRRLEKELGIGG